jgi:hypothetical protein
MNTTDYQKLAEQIVRESRSRPDFSYSGNLPIGVTWALTFARHRDSKSSEVRHYEAIRKSLEKRFPDDIQEERFNHWAVGWTEELAVRMLDEEGNVTGAGKAVIDKTQTVTELLLHGDVLR